MNKQVPLSMHSDARRFGAAGPMVPNLPPSDFRHEGGSQQELAARRENSIKPGLPVLSKSGQAPQWKLHQDQRARDGSELPSLAASIDPHRPMPMQQPGQLSAGRS